MTHPLQAAVERADWWRDHLRGRCRTGGRGASPGLILVADVKRAVCEYYGITAEKLVRKTRDFETVRPRQVAHFVARRFTSRSLPEIGRMIGGFDHTTVMNSSRRIESLMETDGELAADVDAIMNGLLHGW